jgi:hypothetical protein
VVGASTHPAAAAPRSGPGPLRELALEPHAPGDGVDVVDPAIDHTGDADDIERRGRADVLVGGFAGPPR